MLQPMDNSLVWIKSYNPVLNKQATKKMLAEYQLLGYTSAIPQSSQVSFDVFLPS